MTFGLDPITRLLDVEPEFFIGSCSESWTLTFMPLSLGSLHHESKQRRQEEASTFYDPSSEVKFHHFCFILVVSEKVTRPKPFYRRKKAHKHKKEPTIAKDQFRSYFPPQSHGHCSGDCTLEVTEGRQC